MRRKYLILIVLAGILGFVAWCFLTSSCSSAGCVYCGIFRTGYRNSVIYRQQCEARLLSRCRDCQIGNWEGEIEAEKEFTDCIKRWWPKLESSDLSKCSSLKDTCLNYE
jgi:hypothetical protein